MRHRHREERGNVVGLIGICSTFISGYDGTLLANGVVAQRSMAAQIQRSLDEPRKELSGRDQVRKELHSQKVNLILASASENF